MIDPSMRDSRRNGERWRSAIPAAIIIVIALAALKSTTRTTLAPYDEGVYYYQGVLITRGLTPYVDYFVPQPPGIIVLGAASHAVGLGMTGPRIVSWLCGLIIFWQTASLTRRSLSHLGLASDRSLGFAAAALVALSNHFLYIFTEGATCTIAMTISLAAVQILAANRRHSAWIAGVVLAASTAFRLQPLSLAPCVVVGLIVARGIRGGVRPVIEFSIALAGTLLVIHGSLTLLLTHYYDDAFRFQFERSRYTFARRFAVFRAYLAEAQIGFGLLASAALAGSRSPAIRGAALATLLLVALTVLTGNVLYISYLAVASPFLAVAAVVALESLRQATGTSATVPLAVLAAFLGTTLQLKSELQEQWRRDGVHRAFIDEVRKAPGRLVLTDDGRVGVFSGKELVPDYYSTDPNALYQLSRDHFQAWLLRTLPQAEIIAMTPTLVAWITAEDAKLMVKTGKPIVFESEATREQFRILTESR